MTPFLAVEDKFWERDWYGTTVLHPLALVALIVLGALIFVLPRRHAVFSILVMACFVASAQRISIFGLDFTLLRCLICIGWVRVFFRGEYRGFVWKPIDKLVLWWGVVGTITYVIQQQNGSAFVNRLGWLLDSTGMYFLFRSLVHHWRDFDGIVTTMIAIAVPVSLIFLVESRTGRNLFSIFGGVPEITVEREGRLRCQGAFSHPIMAGCFWVGVLPWIGALWWAGPAARVRALIGTTACLGIILLCASSTPIAGVLVVALAAAVFPFRAHMRKIRWAILLGIIGLEIVMKAPVYHLIARIDLVDGSTGYHRYRLIDAAVHRFGEWAFMGTRSTAHWGWGLADVTNEYILQGVRGGALTLALFIAIMVYGYKGVGAILRDCGRDRTRAIQAWSLGAALVAHTLMFIAVSYFGQIQVIWFLLLAMIGSLTPDPQTQPVAASTVVRSEVARPSRARPTHAPGRARVPKKPATNRPRARVRAGY